MQTRSFITSWFWWWPKHRQYSQLFANFSFPLVLCWSTLPHTTTRLWRDNIFVTSIDKGEGHVRHKVEATCRQEIDYACVFATEASQVYSATSLYIHTYSYVYTTNSRWACSTSCFKHLKAFKIWFDDWALVSPAYSHLSRYLVGLLYPPTTTTHKQWYIYEILKPWPI